jgi:predicted DNA-binding protein
MTEKKRKVGRPKGSKSPKTKLKPDAEKKSVRRQFRFAEDEFGEIQAAALASGVTVSEFLRASALEKATLIKDKPFSKRIRFLRERTGKPDSTIIDEAIQELYQATFHRYINELAEKIREMPHVDRKPVIKELIRVLYWDVGDEKQIKKYLLHLNVPAILDRVWRLGDIRKLLK